MIDLIWSQDDFAAEELVSQSDKSAPAGAEVVHLQAETSGVPGLHEALFAGSLFASQRLVTVKGAEKLNAAGLKDLVSLVCQPHEATKLTVVAVADRQPAALIKALSGISRLQKIERPKRGELIAWVTRQMKLSGINAAPQAAAALVETVGNDLRELSGAVDQLSVRAGAGARITPEHVHAQFRKTAEQPVWALFDALLDHDRHRSFVVLQALDEQGEDAIAILFALVSQVRYLLRTRSVLARTPSIADKDLATSVGVSPGRASVLRRQSTRASNAWLLSCHSLLAQADIDLKGGETQGRFVGTVLPPSLVLEKLVGDIIQSAKDLVGSGR